MVYFVVVVVDRRKTMNCVVIKRDIYKFTFSYEKLQVFYCQTIKINFLFFFNFACFTPLINFNQIHIKKFVTQTNQHC